MALKDGWGSDVPVSMPVPPTRPVLLDFGGFGFCENGPCFAMNDMDLENMKFPAYGPGEYA